MFCCYFWEHAPGPLELLWQKPLSKEIGGFAVAAWISLFCGPMLLLGSFIFDGNTLNYFLSANLEGWLTVAYLGLIMQPLAYGTWYHVIGRNPIHKVMPVMLLFSSYWIIHCYFFTGRRAHKQVFLGGTIILFGVAIILFSKEKNKQ